MGYDQTSLRKVTDGEGPGHYVLRYLTAAELIELANVPVSTAELGHRGHLRQSGQRTNGHAIASASACTLGS